MKNVQDWRLNFNHTAYALNLLRKRSLDVYEVDTFTSFIFMLDENHM